VLNSLNKQYPGHAHVCAYRPSGISVIASVAGDATFIIIEMNIFILTPHHLVGRWSWTGWFGLEF
jgi:hypothetical protein